MNHYEDRLHKANEIISRGRDMGLGQLATEDTQLYGREVKLKGKDYINFSSCSYFGLEMDPRLKASSIDAIDRYGTQFSSSRAYISLGLYTELEKSMEEIFGQPIILAPTVSLGHVSNIPILVKENDAVILDEQMHTSVSTATGLLTARKITVEMVRHSRMDKLEERIIELSKTHKRIWYMLDGVYSIYGDLAPVKELYALLEKYNNLHLYVDDSHGMSWAGKYGRGYFLSQAPYFHDRLYLVSGMAKCFGSAGGILVYPNVEIRNLVRNCGTTMIFSGPMQPAVLGACIASARIHLSRELEVKQKQLQDKIRFFNQTAKLYELPLIGESNSPINFIGVGSPNVGYNIVKRMMEAGFFLNLSVYPSVSEKHTGLRMPITLHHTMEDIDLLLKTISIELKKALVEEAYSMKEIFKAFKLPYDEKLGISKTGAAVEREIDS
ncbi:MAG: aminotransferase class I/II-fold pyridoxal phosphate-dependent enzyme [Bacteroidetes bacterium]|nr:aminotransferase class I/II-fold pyridoxal phosphate-dependent enzyme [Bacteroidota bacterium]